MLMMLMIMMLGPFESVLGGCFGLKFMIDVVGEMNTIDHHQPDNYSLLEIGHRRCVLTENPYGGGKLETLMTLYFLAKIWQWLQFRKK